MIYGVGVDQLRHLNMEIRPIEPIIFLIGNSKKYIREGQKAAPHTKGILSNPKAKKTKARTPHQPLGDRYPLQEA